MEPGTRQHAGGLPAIEVRPARPGEIGALAAMLSRAFMDDPVASYLFPGTTPRRRRRRSKGLEAFFGAQLRKDLLAFGGVYTTEDRAGAAAWAPPGKPPLTGLAGLLAVLPVAPYLGAGVARALRFVARMETAHAAEPHWYLATLGTEPARQGRGVGSAMLAPVLARCDRQGYPARLESSNPRNLPFYRRQGFEVVRELAVGAGGPTLTLMRREPRPPRVPDTGAPAWSPRSP